MREADRQQKWKDVMGDKAGGKRPSPAEAPAEDGVAGKKARTEDIE